MDNSDKRFEIEIYSEKYDVYGTITGFGYIDGTITNYDYVARLIFFYNEKPVVLDCDRKVLLESDPKEAGIKAIESYIDDLHKDNVVKKTQLHYWYIDNREINGEKVLIGHGVVTGNNNFPDSLEIYTSPIKEIRVDEKENEAVLVTTECSYHCPLAYCNFEKQDGYPEIIPGYDILMDKYQGSIEYPSIEKGKLLLVLSNFCEYYFHSVYYIPENTETMKPMKYFARPHVGMSQDSYLINVWEPGIDIRYFPHYRNIELYIEETKGSQFFIENIGDVALYAKTHVGVFKIEPGERKEIVRENAEIFYPVLSKGDLYPAIFMD